MKQQGRRSVLVWVALAATLAATVWVEIAPQETVPVAAAMRRPTAKPTRAAAQTPQQAQIRMRQPISQAPGDLFPADQVEQAANGSDTGVEPTVPPMPFKYAGKLVEGAVTTAFLTDAQQNLLVRTGDIIGDEWRVESINPQQIHLTYMPLQTAVILNTGEEY